MEGRILASLIAEAVAEWQNQYKGEEIVKVKVWFADETIEPITIAISKEESEDEK